MPVFGDGLDLSWRLVGERREGRGIVLEPSAIEARQTIPCAEPDEAVAVAHDTVDDVVGQALLNGIMIDDAASQT